MADANKAAAKDSDLSGVDEKKSDVSNKNHAEHESKSIVDTVKEKAAGAYTFVAGGEGDKGLVGTVKEKAAEACHFVAEKFSEATHALSGDKEAPKDKASEKTSEVKADAQK